MLPAAFKPSSAEPRPEPPVLPENRTVGASQERWRQDGMLAIAERIDGIVLVFLKLPAIETLCQSDLKDPLFHSIR